MSYTKDELDRLQKIADIGCIICKLYEEEYSPCSIHHLDGKTKPGAHFKTIGLCGRHHQSDDANPLYDSVHGNKFRFEKRYKSQAELLKITNELIE